jgi:radical SAM-linked protein
VRRGPDFAAQIGRRQHKPDRHVRDGAARTERLMAQRQPTGPAPEPAVQRVRIRYAKRGRLRFTSHRDFARALERAVRRADLPMAFSAGFNPHPKISYLGAAPTGVASEAEYLELSLIRRVEPAELREGLDAALPVGLDILDVVESSGGSLADRLQASCWRLELPGVAVESLQHAVDAFLASESVLVSRLLKQGRREIDARLPIISATVESVSPGGKQSQCAILVLVVAQASPAVRPDDVLSALGQLTGLALAVPPIAVRVAQGPLDDNGVIGDPLAEDRRSGESASST